MLLRNQFASETTTLFVNVDPHPEDDPSLPKIIVRDKPPVSLLLPCYFHMQKLKFRGTVLVTLFCTEENILGVFFGILIIYWKISL